jgi:hypothetical protein
MSTQFIPKLLSLVKSYYNKSVTKNKQKENKSDINYTFSFGVALITLLIVKVNIDENKYSEQNKSHDVKGLR